MLDAYEGIAPKAVFRELAILAEALRGRSLLHINSTRSGGGVAELLSRLVPLMESLGVPARWEVITGDREFFEITKSMHNALQGADVEIPHRSLEHYQNCVRENAGRISWDADVIMVHDLQPAYLIDHCTIDPEHFVWRCHIDLSHPNDRLWRFLSRAVAKYRMAIFHVPQFARQLPISQVLIPPSIDPLSDKSKNLTDDEVTAVTDRYGIDRRRPVLLQVSRFDRFKDPLGVVKAFRLVRGSFDCQLVLAGGSASDDPEGGEVLAEVLQAVGDAPDIFVLSLPIGSDLEINALQRAATIVLQKSTREGFGLTVTEAMWKGKPVIGGAAGGIPAQIVHGVTGFLVHSPEGAAFRLRYLLSHPRAAARMGNRGREHVRRNFLITRHLRDYLLVMLTILHGLPEEPIRLDGRAEPR